MAYAHCHSAFLAAGSLHGSPLPLPVPEAYTIPLLAQPLPAQIRLLLVASLLVNIRQVLQGVGTANLFLLRVAQVVHVLLDEDLHRPELPAALHQHAAQVVPGALVLGCQGDLGLGVGDLAVDDVGGDLGVGLGSVGVRGGVARVGEDEEEAVGPGRVVADVVVDHALEAVELAVRLVLPHAQLARQVLAVAPHVVILGVLGEHLHDEGALAPREPLHLIGRVGDGGVVVVEQELTVVPDLVVLEVVEGGLVEPLELVQQRHVEVLDVGEAIQPDGVVCRVHGDDMLRQLEAARAVFLRGHDCPQIGHRYNEVMC